MSEPGQPSKEQYNLLLGELAAHPIASRVPPRIRQMGLDSCFAVFSDFEMLFSGGFSHLIIRRHKMQSAVHISQELAPALACAHLHFGDELPQDLIRKLRNNTQTLDTLFELSCLGLFRLCHSVSYEPTLTSGKVPDLKISPVGFRDVYVECKSQHMMESEYQRILQKYTSLCFEAVENTNVQKLAWEKNLRTEIRLSATPSPDDLTHLRKIIAGITIDDILRGMSVGQSIYVLAVPRNEPCLTGPSSRIGHVTVGPVSTKISDENTHIVAYSWPGIDMKRRRSQRNLLAKARRKLSAIPAGSYGMICLQVFGTKQLKPDVQASVIRPEFTRVPFVWINPLNESELISRNDALQIRDAIFKPLQNELGVANKTSAGDAGTSAP